MMLRAPFCSIQQCGDSDSTDGIRPLNLHHPLRTINGVEYHFTRLFEKVHRTSKHAKMLRIQVGRKVLQGIPFLYKTEFIFILQTLAEVAAPASFLRPYGTGQGNNRLWNL